jgi:hypothetical protein
LTKEGKQPGRKTLPKLITTPQPLSIRVRFTFAGDIIPEQKRSRMFGRYNDVKALSCNLAGFLVGGSLADFQTSRELMLTPLMSTFLGLINNSRNGTVLFALKVVKPKPS